jgi:small subunit ribosomal protein S2
MASLVKELVEAGIHFGHRSTNWNPKMKPYIYGKRNRIHVIDVRETVKGLLLARKFLTRIVSKGNDVLFVGTKRQARPAIEQHARDSGMHWVTERWLGGTLTNFRTIRERLKRLTELEQLDESGQINSYSKKMEATLRREQEKIRRNLDGIRNMTKLPGAIVIVDVKHESNAVKEARKLGIPTVSLIDTDSDPDMVDIAIPGNDDAMKAIEIVIKSLCAAINEGKQQTASAGLVGPDADRTAPARRSARAMFRAEDADAGAPSADPSAPAPPAAAEAEATAEATAEAPIAAPPAEPDPGAQP